MRPDYCPVVKEPCQEPRCMINGCELRQYQNRAHKREWQGLTDDEIAEGQKQSWVDKQAFESAVWWAEAKLKAKNGF